MRQYLKDHIRSRPAPIWLSLSAAIIVILPIIGNLGMLTPALDLINAALPAIALTSSVLVIFSYLRSHYYSIIYLLIGFAISITMLIYTIFGSSGSDAAMQGSQITLVTLSAYHANETPLLLRNTIERSNADIVLLQESDGAARHAIKASLPKYYRLRSCSRPRCSITILSRWPLTPIGKRRSGQSDLPDIFAVHIAHPAAPFNVIAVHLPRLTHANAVAHRNALIAMIKTLGPKPLLVAGDFNLTPGMIALSQFEVSSGLIRAVKFTPTYPAPPVFPPLFPIDHVYLSSAWSSQGCDTIARTGSDHLGLKCVLNIRQRHSL